MVGINFLSIFVMLLKTKTYITMKQLTIENLYKEYHNVIFLSLKQQLFGNVVVAEELANEVFIRFNRMIDSYNPEKAKVITILYTIKNNLVIDHLRKNKVPTDSIDKCNWEDAPVSTIEKQTPLDVYNTKELGNKIAKAIDDLNPRFKIIAVLYFQKEYSYEEISDELSMPLGTVKTILFRCRETLQKNLKEFKQYAC